jgi:Zn-dependent protease with chaperone function
VSDAGEPNGPGNPLNGEPPGPWVPPMRPDREPPPEAGSPPVSDQHGRPDGENQGDPVKRQGLGSLRIGLPLCGWSLVVMLWFGWLLGFEPWGWIILIAWLASGAISVLRPIEEAIAKVVLRFRRPTMNETQRLRVVWPNVSHSAGVKGDDYDLWVHESDSINAPAGSGRNIGVTSWALKVLPPRHLHAVLAHELAHHLGQPRWLNQLLYWYSLPGRLAAWLIRATVRMVVAGNAFGCLIIGLLVFGYVGLILLVLIADDSKAIPVVILTPLLAPFLVTWLNRMAERDADRMAADLGYGPTLIEVFYGWQVQNEASERPARESRSSWASSHPPVAERIRALENYLGAAG